MIVKQTARDQWLVEFNPAEFRRWKKFIAHFRSFVEVPARLRTKAQLWHQFVREFLVRGGARPLERADQDQRQKKNLVRETSLRALLNPEGRRELRKRLEGKTRFPQKAARAILRGFHNKSVVRRNRFVLLNGLKAHGEIGLRKQIYCRYPELGWKGTSDFLISSGIARDLVAIDTRILSCLQKHFGAPEEIHRARSDYNLYLGVESALRKVAERNKISLAELDRMIFQASGTSMLDCYVKKR